jgi:nucleoside-diphosphate-sugar epimerase
MTVTAVVGGSGFLGSALLADLHSRGLQVRSISRSARRTGAWPHFVADIRDLRALTPALDGVTAVFHAAGIAHVNSGVVPQEELLSTNVEGTRNLIRAARSGGARRIVFASSISVYGTNAGRVIDEGSPCAADSEYGRAKLLAEGVLMDESVGIDALSLRLASLYGPDDPGNVIRLARMIRTNRFILIGSGANRKCLLHLEDAVAASRLALSAPIKESHAIFNVAGEPHTMREIVGTICEALGRDPPRLAIPQTMATLASRVLSEIGRGNSRAAALAWAVRKSLSDDLIDSSAFRRAFGWYPRIALETGIRGALASSFVGG